MDLSIFKGQIKFSSTIFLCLDIYLESRINITIHYDRDQDLYSTE